MNNAFQLKITATNIGPDGGAAITPLWISSHDGSFDSFSFGETASTGIEIIAEDGLVGLEGTVPGFNEALAMFGTLDPTVLPPQEDMIAGIFADSNAAANGGSQGIVLDSVAGFFPGQSSSALLPLGDNPETQNRYFSFAAMFFPSNDAFIGNENPFQIELFDEFGNFIGADFIITGDQVWDAGTEINDEDVASVPFSLETLRQGTPEGGTVQPHPGFLPPGAGGVLDVVSPLFSFPNADFQTTNQQVLRITIEQVPVVNPINFRTIDGTGNNDDEGATNTQLLRLFDNAYEDGISVPRGGNFNTSTLPNPRTISNVVANQTESVPNFLNASDWLWQWGQFIDHDLDLNDTHGAIPPQDIMFIEVPNGDPTFPDGSQLPFIRVTAASGTGTGVDNPREVNNQITAFIDASSVYGSDEERAEFLRDRSSQPGFLKTSLSDDGEALLPLNDPDNPQANATGGVPLAVKGQFVAGDVRANEQIGLTAVHTLFVREHNRLAAELYERLNAGDAELTAKFETFAIAYPLFSDEDALDEFIYQSARKVVGAQVQAITYNEFLPLLIGEGTLEAYEGYDADINPQVSTEFANAAYRLGHTLLNNQIQRVDSNGLNETSLVDAFFNPADVQEHGVDTVLTGLIFQEAQEVDHLLVDGVRNFLFPADGGGLDLAAVNIARGRETGILSYTAVYEDLFGQAITSFSDLGSSGLGLFSDDVVSLFEAAYDSVDQIDLWLGGVAELPDEHGGVLGPTLSFFIADQFGRARDGDEFFYLREEELADLELLSPGTPAVTLADVIRNNSDSDHLVPDDVFTVPFENRITGDDTNNRLNGTNANDLVEGLGGDDVIRGFRGRDYAFGGAGSDRIWGNGHNDVLFGGDGNDALFGNSGVDSLVGGDNNDRLLGGSGNDWIEGQAGNDVAIGGSGRDTFVFGSDILNDGFNDIDTIQGFQSRDTLDVEDYLNAGGSISTIRINNRLLRIDLSNEDQVNVIGSRAALNALEAKL